jgi:large subunit ribosomal protein L9
MAVEVLLRRTIEGVGNVGDVVRVKNGYARNYLIPKGYASFVSPDAMAQIEKDREVEARRQAELARYNQALAEKLESMTLTIEVRAGDDGHLYGSVGPKHVIAAFEDEGFPFQERQIRFEPVRELGEYEVPVHLSHDLVVVVKLWVVQDARDVEMLQAASAEAAAEAGEGEGDEAEATAPAPTAPDESTFE